MTVPKINSAHGSDTRNIINRAIEVLNRLGIDVQHLVAEGQLTPEQYAELITVIHGHIKSGEVNINDFDEPTRQTFLEAQGIEVDYVLGNENVRPYNTTFFKPVNRFDKNNTENVYGAYMGSGGVYEAAGYMYSHEIPIKNNDVIYVVSGASDVFRGVLLDKNGEIIEQIRNTAEGVINSDGYYQYTVNNMEAEYIIINFIENYEETSMVIINQEINDGNKNNYRPYNVLEFIDDVKIDSLSDFMATQDEAWEVI